MTETELGPCDLQILDWEHQGRLGYLKPSDEWCLDGEPMPDVWQDYCYRLLRAGFLPEFEEFTS